MPEVSMCVDPDRVPFERINEKGNHEGIAADLMKLVADRIGIKLELLRTQSWEESLNASQKGKCQILSLLNETPGLDEWLLFTDPLLSDPIVFITREEHSFISDPAHLSDETIVFPSGTSMEERVRKEYPNISILTTETEMEAMNMVSEKKADMTMQSLIVADYTIKKEGLFNLKIAGRFSTYTNNLRIGIIKSEPMLRDIINKGVNTITQPERWKIINNHASVNVQTAVDYGLIVKTVAGFLLLAIIGAYYHYRLRTLNKELKRLSQNDTLTEVYNRRKIDMEIHREFERTHRYSRPFSIIICDIDHFKTINDELGRLMGDRILTAIAQIIKYNIRSCDLVGRWGGEEFLVLCPETDTEGALTIARRICDAVQNSSFESGRKHTISIGVAVLMGSDSIDSLLLRAYTALNRAKSEERNCVCAL